MSDTIIKVENLGKKYKIRHQGAERYQTFRETLVRKAVSLFKKSHHTESENYYEEFWALKDINFDIKRGDKVGIIGRNGAGKSTLLKLLSRITEPSEGRICINGRIASLLEVGTGFHPELTGRENIYLNGAILGMSRKEIQRKFDEIVAFAEVEKFLDTPVKRYSSGMYVRLAFSVAAHLEPEILVVDEVLAVGDLEFQKKCLGKMSEVSSEGRTILFVSHNMTAISSLCNRAILLEKGRIAYDGKTEDAIQKYMQPNKNIELSTKLFDGPLRNKVIFKEIKINGQKGSGVIVKPNEEITFEIIGESKESFDEFKIVLSVYKDDIRVFSTSDVREESRLEKGWFRCTMKVPSYLLRPGFYTIALGGRKNIHSDWLYGTQIIDFIVDESWDEHYQRYDEGIINIPFCGNRTMIEKQG
jgi:lipopolysaccharide transport system ATP-binding protein